MVEKMFEIPMNEPDKRGFQKALDYSKTWCAEHQWAVGVGEMALGAAVIAWGLQSGHIHMGTDVVATQLSDGGIIGGATGAGLGGIGGSILGSIGVAGAFTFGIPALALAGGGALILGAAGYGVGDLVQKFLTPPGGFGDFFFGASILGIGIALLIHGARRVVKDANLLKLASKIKDGVIYVAKLTVKVVAKTLEELHSLFNDLLKGGFVKEVAHGTTVGVATVVGTGVGGSLAAGSVTVLGSHALGGAALSLGLVSAPLWPVIAGGAAGLAVGLAAWKGVKYLFSDDAGETQTSTHGN